VSKLPLQKQFPGSEELLVFKVYKAALIAVIALLMLQFSPAQATEIRDPMQPPEYALKKFRQAKNNNKPAGNGVKIKKAEIKSLKLSSIIYSPTRKIAIIDDQMLSVGATINGARLVKIERNSARLVRNGKVINLRLPDDLTAIKKTPVESDT
jgi:hypothetical protein